MTPVAAAGRPDRLGPTGRLMLRLWTDAWVWSAGVQALSSGMSLVVSVIAARLLGVAGFGAYVLVHAGVVILSVLQYQLVSGPMAIVSGRRARSRAYFGTVARAALAVSALVGVATALYCAALVSPADGSDLPLPLAGSVFAVGFVAHDGAKRLAFAMNRPRVAFGCELGRHALLILAVAGLWLGPGVSTPGLLVCGGLSGIAAAAPIYAPVLRARPRAGLWRAVRGQHWLLGRWLLLVVLVSAAHEQLVTILAGSWLGEDAAAALRAAQILLGPLLVLMTSIENIVPRRAAQHLRAGGEPALRAYLLRVLLALEVPVVAICAVIATWGADILGALLGRGYAGFGAVAAIIALGPPITLAREIAVIHLRTTHRTRAIFAAFSASALVTLLSAYPLIHGLGMRGAACMIVLGHAVSMIVIVVRAVSRGRTPSPASAAAPAGGRR